MNMDDAGDQKSQDAEADVARRLKPGPDYDPVNLMTQIFDEPASFAGPAEDVLLSWLMRLSPDVNQTEAAKRVLSSVVGDLSEDASPECSRLYTLLQQASVNPGVSGNSRRRGGRSARTDA